LLPAFHSRGHFAKTFSGYHVWPHGHSLEALHLRWRNPELVLLAK
jgi:hypothetical protein